jgi:hypothetical protein
MNFSRGKVQILYSYLPGAVFPHDGGRRQRHPATVGERLATGGLPTGDE